MPTITRYILRRLFAAWLLAQFLFPARGSGQTTSKYLARGTIELGGIISYQHTSLITQGTEFPEQRYTVFSFLPYAGYFVTDNLEIGLNPLGVQTYSDSQDKITTYNILLAPSYNFDAGGSLYPFAEAQLGYSRELLGGSLAGLNVSKRDGFSWGGRAGVKWEAVRHCLVNAAVQYQEITLKPSGQSERSGSDIFLLSAGLTFWF